MIWLYLYLFVFGPLFCFGVLWLVLQEEGEITLGNAAKTLFATLTPVVNIAAFIAMIATLVEHYGDTPLVKRK